VSSNGAPPPPSRPQIIVRRELSAVVDEAERACFTTHVAACLRGWSARPRRAPGGARSRRCVPAADMPVIVPVSVEHLRERMDRAADWIHLGGENGPRPALPPLWVAKTLLERREWPFPPLEAVLETPTMRSDGTILERPGYDVSTGILYEPGTALFRVFRTRRRTLRFARRSRTSASRSWIFHLSAAPI